MKLDIINQALIHIGSEPVDDLESAVAKGAKLAVRQYDISRKDLLRQHSWNFAVSTTQLEVADTVPPDFAFDNRYDLPGDFIRLHQLYDHFDLEYQLMGGQLYIDLDPPVNLFYIANESDEDKFDPLFTHCLSLHLAKTIAYSVTGDLELLRTMEQLYERQLAKAKWADSTENSRLTFEASRWLESRYGLSRTKDRFHSFVPPPG